MSKKTETAASESPAVRQLKPEIQKLSDNIVKGLSVDKTAGVISETTANFNENLPEGLTVETVKAVHDYGSDFVAASAHAVGTIAVDAMKSNKKLDVVTASLKAGGKDVISHSVHRSKEYTFGTGADKKTVVKPGQMASAYDVYGSHNSGQLKIAREQVGALAAEKLAK